ncbi:hypothetical protein Sango_0631100 [Sesamum angolense]|uniref:Uncharacterized protein n=1 Tax=Sesamum angolense TaxID=2727404 RepID=A0AAE1X6Z2_9LAMI|nr:hypothetical protein Sango_0631100 [Sesamum angolense]
MDATEVEEALRVFEAALSQIKWRLKPASKRRLQTDILALCSTMRPCIMVDYGGKMPELGDHLCAFLNHCKKYYVEIKRSEHLEFVKSSLSMGTAMLFVDLENDPPKIMTQGQAEQSPAVMQLLSAQKFFSSVFHEMGPTDNLDAAMLASSSASSSWFIYYVTFHWLHSWVFSCLACIAQYYSTNETGVELLSLRGHLIKRSIESENLLNAARWLLGYPVIYLFGKDYIEHAVYSLSTKSLHIYQIFVNSSGNLKVHYPPRPENRSMFSIESELQLKKVMLQKINYAPFWKSWHRVNAFSKGYQKEELMSFTVPFDLSLEGSNEPWAQSFLAHMRGRWENCKHIWGSLHLEVSGCYPQAIAL